MWLCLSSNGCEDENSGEDGVRGQEEGRIPQLMGKTGGVMACELESLGVDGSLLYGVKGRPKVNKNLRT